MNNLNTMVYLTEKKSQTTAYLLWFFFGYFAAHRFYLKCTRWALCELALFWGGWFLFWIGIAASAQGKSTFIHIIGGWFAALGGILIFSDVFMIPGLIKRINYKLMHAIQSDKLATSDLT